MLKFEKKNISRQKVKVPEVSVGLHNSLWHDIELYQRKCKNRQLHLNFDNNFTSEYRSIFRPYETTSGILFINMLIKFINKTEISFFYRNEKLLFLKFVFHTFSNWRYLNFTNEFKYFVYNFLNILLYIQVHIHSFIKPKNAVLLEN